MIIFCDSNGSLHTLSLCATCSWVSPPAAPGVLTPAAALGYEPLNTSVPDPKTIWVRRSFPIQFNGLWDRDQGSRALLVLLFPEFSYLWDKNHMRKLRLNQAKKEVRKTNGLISAGWRHFMKSFSLIFERYFLYSLLLCERSLF